ncbi:MAG: DNRLRE domain-containing protein [Planctomycetota bacterium]|nr:DNRLRE domain-containing protein [Planctomycetota bacterium]
MFALAASLGLSAFVHADTITLSSVKDATMIQDPTGEWALGAAYNFYAGRVGENAGGTFRRGLIQCDCSSIPAGSVITIVQLKLNMSNTQPGTFTVGIHKSTMDWGEGTSFAFGGGGAPATENDATWNYRFYPDVPWPTPGGSFVATASATKSIGAVGWYTFGSTYQLVSDVQDWVDHPETNMGWTVKGNETTLQSVKRFDAREAGATQPQLIVTFTPPPSNPADVNNDGAVNALDLTPMLAAWGTPNAAADIDNDGTVDARDLAMILAAWTG